MINTISAIISSKIACIAQLFSKESGARIAITNSINEAKVNNIFKEKRKASFRFILDTLSRIIIEAITTIDTNTQLNNS